MPKVWVIQKPRDGDYLDMEALRALGEVNYALPSAPNLHDQQRVTADLKELTRIIATSGDSDVFVSLGGSFLSQYLFGSAFSLSGKESVNVGLYSRGRDDDGRRGRTAGSYRVIRVDLGLTDQDLADCLPAAA